MHLDKIWYISKPTSKGSVLLRCQLSPNWSLYQNLLQSMNQLVSVWRSLNKTKQFLKWEASWESHPSWRWYYVDTILTSDWYREQCLPKERFLCIQLTIFKHVKIIWYLGTEFSINDSRTLECSWDFVNEYVVEGQTQQHYSEPPIIVWVKKNKFIVNEQWDEEKYLKWN